MDYICHCGAKLRYEPNQNRWFCPQGHDVYPCNNCGSLGKSVPLQWIPQYQRWYCYECKQYAPPTHGTVNKKPEELEEPEYEEGEQREEDGQYTLGIVQGSRVDESCFSCKSLKFTKHDTHLKCNARFGAGYHRYLEPLLQDVTIRPEGSAGICVQRIRSPDGWELHGDELAAKLKWKKYFERRTLRQIWNHEKVAKLVEMYHVDFVGHRQNGDDGARVKQVPVNRDSLRDGDVVLVDKVNKKVWIRIPAKESGLRGFLKNRVETLAESHSEDSRSLSFLRDALKRNIMNFAFEKTYAGTESPEFWSAIAKGEG